MTVNERSMKDAIEINKDYGISFRVGVAEVPRWPSGLRRRPGVCLTESLCPERGARVRIPSSALHKREGRESM